MKYQRIRRKAFSEYLNNIEGQRIELGGSIVWTNAGEVVYEAKGGKHKAISDIVREGVRRQARYREWEEDPGNWVMYVDRLGQYWDEVSGEKLDKGGVERHGRRKWKKCTNMKYVQRCQ